MPGHKRDAFQISRLKLQTFTIKDVLRSFSRTFEGNATVMSAKPLHPAVHISVVKLTPRFPVLHGYGGETGEGVYAQSAYQISGMMTRTCPGERFCCCRLNHLGKRVLSESAKSGKSGSLITS